MDYIGKDNRSKQINNKYKKNINRELVEIWNHTKFYFEKNPTKKGEAFKIKMSEININQILIAKGINELNIEIVNENKHTNQIFQLH